MSSATMLLRLLSMKGQIATMKTLRDCKVRKGQAVIQKESVFQCRIGVDYENMAKVQAGREDGTLPAENAGLPWGEWMPGMFPYVIQHKGNHYFRCTSLNNNHIPAVRFLRNGQEISKDEAQVVCLASEFNHDKALVFTVKVESILEVNGQA